jgi:hypothetical protein
MAAAALVAGVGSSVAAAAIIAAGVRAFGLADGDNVAKLANLRHPLQVRLLQEAPGTYHHSQMVSALAERAAARIGADALLARVGAMYHDIGKLSQPGFFVENFGPGQVSAHDALDPAVSAAIIRDHVVNGLRIAAEYNLPTVVRDFIPQHHGTRLVTYFYRRAGGAGRAVNRDQFRYAGPRPQSREAALVMLADSCEAVVRADVGHSQDRIEELVDRVFAERCAEGELDECDLTMRELRVASRAFREMLQAVYHQRIPYPEPLPDEVAGLARG